MVSMIQVEGSDLPPPEPGAEVPSIRDVPEEDDEDQEEVHSEAADPPDLSRASVSEKSQIQPEEQRKDSEPLGRGVAAGVMEDKETPSDLEGGGRLPPPPPTGAAEGTSQLPLPPHDGGGSEAGEEETPTSSASPQPGEDQTAQ